MALQGNHYRGHDSTPSAEYLRDMQARVGGTLGKSDDTVAGADDPLAKAVAAVDALAKALDIATGPLAKAAAPLTPLEKATAAMDALAKAFASEPGADALVPTVRA